MPRQFRLSSIAPGLLIVALGLGLTSAQLHGQAVAAPPPATGACDVDALAASKASFLQLSNLHASNPGDAAIDESLQRASADYVTRAERCYQELYSPDSGQRIDDGIMWYSPDGSQPFVTWGTKWGAGSPFAGGTNTPGPGIPGGVVTYSYVGTGITTDGDASLALTSLPTYSSCFLTEISNAFAAWSAVANLHFVEVPDGGAPFNSSGATGDIRIATHTFDGPSSVLAHAYGPPPNGTSAAGDLHFDRAENWSCTAGAGKIDIGIVATHEIGHSLGLGHETTLTAVMNPTYNSSVTAPLADDVAGASSIYGPRTRAISDFDGDGKSDLALYRPSAGTWWILKSGSTFSTYSAYAWGVTGDVTVVGDYDGDGRTDPAVYRPTTGEWFILKSSAGFGAFDTYTWGVASDLPVPGDFDGDGKSDLALFRRTTGEWRILKSSTGFTASSTYLWGANGDVPVPDDYDGDGKADIAVYRPSTGNWFVLKSAAGYTTASAYAWGATGDRPVPGDYDGDGKADIAVYRSSDGHWYALKSSTNSTTHVAYTWGSGSDVPIAADFDGDGKIDPSVFRAATGEWFLLLSGSSFTTSKVYGWGLSTDLPVLKRD